MAKSDWVRVDEKGRPIEPLPLGAQLRRRRPTGSDEARTQGRRAEDERRRQLEAEAEQRADEWVAGVLREADAADERAERVAEAHDMARLGVNTRVAGPSTQLRGSTISVGDEPMVYGPGSDFSWFRDRYLDATYGMGAALPPRTPGDSIGEVRQRLLRHQRQMQHLATRGGDKHRALIRSYFRELNRPYHLTPSDHSRDDWRNLAFGELRDSSTGSGSLGPFVPPVFLLELFEIFRTAASPVASQARQADLPATGMQVNIPLLTAGVSVSAQGSENADIALSSPTADYATADIVTLSGGVLVSQQYLDRVGPGVTGDEIIVAQQAREAATALDSLAVTAVLANATTITNSGSPSVAALFADVGKASAAIATTEGTRLHPSHVMMPSANAEWFMTQTDSTGRPIWLPSPAATLARVGQANTRSEGYSGFDIAGKMTFADDNLPNTGASPTYSTVLVGDLPNGLLVMTGTPIVDVMPEYEPATLTALIRWRVYCALQVLFPAAFQQITGAAYPVAPTFSGA